MMTKNIGFTLIELIITLAVAAILITVAGPNFLTFIKNNRLTAQANSMVGSLQLARSEAVKRNATVTICRSNNPTNVSPTCATGATGATGTTVRPEYWGRGWVVFVDNGAKAGTIDAGEVILQQHEALSGGNSLDGTGPSTSTALEMHNVISYGGTGFVTTKAGTLALCDNRNESWGKEIIISTTGHISTISAPKDLATIAACSP